MSQKLLKRSNSKGPLRGFVLNTSNATVFPDFDFARVEQMISEDPVARGALSHFIDKFMEGDYAILKRDSFEYDKDFEFTLDTKYRFRDMIVRKAALLGKLFNNAYIEIVRDVENNTKSLNVLDSATIEPITLANGDAVKFRCTLPDPSTGRHNEWSKNDIVWIKFNDRSLGLAPVDMKALYQNLLMKQWVTRFVGWCWATGQYRLLMNPKSASDKDIEDALAYMRRNNENFRSPFFIKGELETKILRDMKEMESIDLFLKYLDNQTLVLMRVPPIDAGIPDASGRSNADAQSNNFNTHITSMKKIIEDNINFDLFPKINKSNSLFRFAPNDRFEEKQIWENVNIMKNMGMTEEVIREYLQDRGMFYGAKVLFEVLPDPVTGAKKDINTMNSRMKSVDKNKQGTGGQSSTRPDQMKKV